MISGAVLILCAQAFDELSRFGNFLGRDRGIGQQQERLFVPRLFAEDLLGGVSRLRILMDRQIGLAELELHVHVVRLQLRGLLEQRIRLNDLALVVIDGAELAQRDRIGRIEPEHLAIVLLGLVVLLGGQGVVGTGQGQAPLVGSALEQPKPATAASDSAKTNRRLLGEAVRAIMELMVGLPRVPEFCPVVVVLPPKLERVKMPGFSA